ncbi:phytanoyl-CoA dioxygenase family protein [Pseudotenacibaculum sp. MALMAid0570]|uniref:phytanoyl-CoA dioxygenase family protein n=1 Tax=Pseudotenacibaculum sp. MALMAid0570 TaxID=3143938 RepID=UPI0032DE69E0
MISVTEKEIEFFKSEGFLVINDLISKEEVVYYKKVYDDFLSNSIDASKYRSDLSGLEDDAIEKITQIMVPSKVFPELLNKPIHLKTQQIAKSLLGNDLKLDFDMLINKAPYTYTPTPWHQDAAYWIDMPDKRALSFWTAIDDASIDNGCMWYTPKSHLQSTLPHQQKENKGALQCEGFEENSIPIELKSGSCVIHHGNTLHYSRGNSTSLSRRAFITNYRPEKMIVLEREKGIDHTGEREVRS